MKYICLLVLFFGIASVISIMKVQVSAISNIKKNKVKDFIGCEPTKESLIHPVCVIEGITEEKDRKKLCDAYTKDLEKQLDCKDKCKDFYKKLNGANVKFAEEQAKYFKGKKDEAREERSNNMAKDQKNQEEFFVQSHCFAEMPEADKDKKKK